jgi:hypothetical protein
MLPSLERYTAALKTVMFVSTGQTPEVEARIREPA